MARVMRVVLLVGALVSLTVAGAVAAKARPASFAGIAFGSQRSALASFMTLKSLGDVEYAVNLSEHYRINGQAPAVFYGFAGGRLFAAYVRLTGVISPAEMAKRLTAEYGKPTITVAAGQEVMRWRRGDLKIKLKYDTATHSLKLGYYSIRYGQTSLGTLVDPEAIDMDSLAKSYEKDKIAKDVTLPKPARVKGYSPYDDGIARPVGQRPGW